jgi:putative transposase
VKFTYVAAEKARGEFKVTELCRALRVSTSGFYASLKRAPSTRTRKDEQLKVLVKESFDTSRKTYGSPRILEDLREGGQLVGRKRVIRLMQEQGLRARARKRFKSTTNSSHDQPVAANILARQFDADAPDRRWVGDTTEMLTASGGRFYLAAIIDLYSRF